ncbi:AIPR family protein [Magnetococcus marinus]|uniref:AIPR family protein n=1 Tax=Magnetococcus marinus TaxID=1124597 RepID=UPI00003C54F5|nr:AIPR family protein [Magnetococcus marinus]
MLFDPGVPIALNPRLTSRIEEVRSLIRDGYVPNVRVVLCNNGKKWNAETQQRMDHAGFPENQVSWVHFNHENIVQVLRRKQSVDETLQLTGAAIVENYDFRRVLIGKVAVTQIAELFDRHGDLLLERNIRRYLGLSANRVNQAISHTVLAGDKQKDFYFFNNGITIICNGFKYNALQRESLQVRLENMHIINGGQTCKTLQQTLMTRPDLYENLRDVFVMVKIYELAQEDNAFVQEITYATNSQNPVDLRDLRSNDTAQKQLALGLDALGYSYKPQREEGVRGGAKNITSQQLAESVLAIWRRRPHQAKFLKKEHFGKLYSMIFHELNPAQALLAVLIFRFVEQAKRRTGRTGVSELLTIELPGWIAYGSYYIAMLMGEQLLKNQGKGLKEVNHLTLEQLVVDFNENRGSYYQSAVEEIHRALVFCYGDREVSLQQLSATFRRGDLLAMLKPLVSPL